ncbi:MAG: hypothetical protein HZB54_01995 [Deltaproteobacteria bacterium]|nr:hypothetical protein [Deltaproteobacteria bacterium]
MNKIRVYIDTNVFKFSATKLLRLRPRKQLLNWGGRTHEATVHDFIYTNPNEKIENLHLKAEADLLPILAELGKKGDLKFIINIETMFESWGIPNMDSKTGKFYNAPYEIVDAPTKYRRMLLGFGMDPIGNQFNFLASIKDKRFLELQKMTGAYQGKAKINRNQLLDAFHLWCAEYNRCEYFLTLDFKLIKMLKNNGKISVKPVKPSELLQEIDVKA